MNHMQQGEILATSTYYDSTFKCNAVKVLPGEFYYTSDDIAIVTVLGSCVAACIRDKITGIGGMNHFMLPSNGDINNPVSESMRYGTYAMEVLINRLIKDGATRERLEAKVFGGGHVMRNFSQENNVGSKNAAFVLEYLKTENISLVAQDLNDIYPRKVFFFPKTGKVLVKKLRMHAENIVLTERDYANRLENLKIGGAVDLF